MTHTPRTAVCLVSGGMDSAVVLAEAKAMGFDAHALSFRYGQRHSCELDAAARVAQELGAREHRTVTVDLSALGGSSLTDDLVVPKDRDHDEIGQGVPSTYVPARNTVFLSVALGWAEVLGATDLFVGVNAVDYSGYPDCRPEFLTAFETLATLATARWRRRASGLSPADAVTPASFGWRGSPRRGSPTPFPTPDARSPPSPARHERHQERPAVRP